MKKISAILLAAALAFALCSCGSSEEPAKPADPAPAEKPAASQPAQQTGFGFKYNGSVIKPGDKMSDHPELGEAKSVFEAESCAFKGLDKVFTYSGFEISTNPDGEEDVIASILLKDDSVTTAEGIYIGSSKDDVVKAYGEPKIAGDYSYTDGCTINIIVLNDAVASVEYL